MNVPHQDRGMVMLCDQAGTITRMLRDDLGLASRVPPGTGLAGLVDTEVREKLDGFLEELHARNAAYDWEITVPIKDGLTPLHFAGARIDQGFLVVIASSREGLMRLNEDLMRINNEQTNALRAALKELSMRSDSPSMDEQRSYDDLSGLNNELANLQREMAKKTAELARLNTQKNDFLGMAAHDLRNPLSVIISFSEFLEEEAADVLNEEHREFVTAIKQTSEFMLRMVVELLDVSTIESGRLNLNREPTDLVPLIGHNIALNSVLAGRKAIAVEFDSPDGGVEAYCDASKIEQVLNNLIGNAVKFSHRDTVVRVKLSVADGIATVEVRDQGQGIPEAELPNVFKPFGKVSVRGTEGESSTGLGLAICRRMIEGHGGKVWVDSQVGKGSSFYFTLPLDGGTGKKPGQS